MQFGAIYVLTAEIIAKGEWTKLTTKITETEQNAQATGAVVEPKPAKKATRAAQKAHVAPTKGRSADKANPGKNAPKRHKKAAARQGGKKAKSGNRARRAEKATPAREGSKTSQILGLLKRPGGATLQEIMKFSEWQPHSVRGFLSGTLGKKMGLTVESTKGEDGERTYSIKS
jgi:hypothetical protein